MKKLKRKLLFTPVALPLMALPSITACTAAPLTKHDELINNLKNVDNPNGQWTSVDYVATPYKNYKLYVHNPELSSYVTSNHTKAQMGELSSKLNKATSFEAKKFEKGTFVPAAQVNDGQAQAYTAVWVRDTVWNVLALYDSGKTEDADAVTTSLMKYFGTEKQIARINDVMNDPKILLEKDGASKAVHIRFDPNTLDDVYIDGKEQTWSHKQNDALGLSISLFIDFASKNLNNVEKWPTQAEDMKTLVRLIAYLNRAEFWNMEDSGAWEEGEKISCSSIGCVVGAFQKVLNAKTYVSGFKEAYDAAQDALGENYKSYSKYDDTVSLTNPNAVGINNGIAHAYMDTIKISIEKGGEAVRYAKTDEEYREGDAAMLDLIYPYKIQDYSYTNNDEKYEYNINSRIKILETVEANNNDFGIIRYKDDTYQCSDFWFANIPTDVTEETFKKRKNLFLEGSEASWFFDSWMAICYGEVIKEHFDNVQYNTDHPAWSQKITLPSTQLAWLENKMHYHINKALAFVNKSGAYRANGTIVEGDVASIPESYTVVTINRTDAASDWYRLASPVDPLRWAQSSLSLMINYFKNSSLIN